MGYWAALLWAHSMSLIWTGYWLASQNWIWSELGLSGSDMGELGLLRGLQMYCVGNMFLFGFDTNIDRGDVCNSLKVKSYRLIFTIYLFFVCQTALTYNSGCLTFWLPKLSTILLKGLMTFTFLCVIYWINVVLFIYIKYISELGITRKNVYSL